MSSTHHLADFLRRQGYVGNLNLQYIQNTHVAGARAALELDKDAFFLNALVSFASCVNSINKSNYSWAFIQAYYTLFYLARTLLAEQNTGIYYVLSKPFKIKFTNGEQFSKLSGNSHDVILKLYQSAYASDTMLSNTINGENPVIWFKENRELINYRLSPFSDPTPPLDLFHYAGGLRKWIYTYMRDTSYSFSEEHAYVAYNVQMINREIETYQNSGRLIKYLTEERMKYLKHNLHDAVGPIDVIVKKLETIMERDN